MCNNIIIVYVSACTVSYNIVVIIMCSTCADYSELCNVSLIT